MLNPAGPDRSRRRTEHRQARRLVRSLTAGSLATTMMCASLLQASVAALSPLLLEDLGISRTRLGLLLSGYYVIAALASAPLGRLVDRLGRRRGLTLVLVLAILANATAAAGGGQVGFGIALLVSGLAVAAANPATNLALAATAPPHGVLMGVKQSGIQLAPILAGVVLVPIAAAYGWRSAIGVAAVVSAVVLLLVHATPGTGPRVISRVSHDRLPEEGVRKLRLLSAYSFAMGIGNASVMVYLALFAHQALSFSEQRAGVLIAVIGAAAVVARIGWSVGVERGRGVLGDERSVLALIALTAMVATGGLLLSTVSPALVWGAAFGIGLSSSAWNGVVMLLLVRGHGAAAGLGRASGRVLGAFFLGMAVGPPLFGVAVDFVGGYPSGWSWVMASFVAALVAALALTRTGTPPAAAEVHAERREVSP